MGLNTVTNENIRRTDSIRVKLSPEMLSRVEALSADYGMPPATFAAFALADFVRRNDFNQKITRQAAALMVKQLGPDMEALMASPEGSQFLDQVVSSASRLGVTAPLDAKARKGDA